MRSFKLRIMAQVLPFLLVAPVLAPAQTPPSRSEATAAKKAGQHDTRAQYTKQQIDQLIAPIALYPDQLLVQVLMAATYPQQLLEAAEWLNDPQHAALKGDELAQALADLPWDPSVKALVAFPQIIAMLTEHLEWTQALGLAFATQQAQVMDCVQGLRQLAVKSGRIKNMKHVTVRKEANAIKIVSAEPDRVFVPVYNPTVVYGQWPDPRHPPVYVAPPRRFASEGRVQVFETVEPGIEVYSYPVVQPLWGWTQPDWGSRRITIKTEEYTRITRGVRRPPNNVWRHEGPIVIVTPSAAPSPNSPPVAVPTGTVAPAQAVKMDVLKERAASHPDKIRVETLPPAAARQENPQAQQPRPETTQAQQPQPDKAQAQQPRPEKAQVQQPQPDKAQAQQPRPEKAQAQQPQPDKPQAQQPRPEKAQAQQPQPEKAQAQQPQPDKPQAQQPRPEKAQAQQPQPDKAQAQQPRPEKAQAQQPQPDKAQAQQPRPEKTQAQQPQPDKAQAQQPRPEKTQAQQPQPDKPQAQQPRPEKTQAQQPQPDKPQAAAKAQAEKAEAEKVRARGQGPANAAAPADRAQNQAGPAAGRRPGTAAEAPGQGSSGPPGPAASPRGQGAAAEHHPARPQADQKDMDNKER